MKYDFCYTTRIIATLNVADGEMHEGIERTELAVSDFIAKMSIWPMESSGVPIRLEGFKLEPLGIEPSE